jgi:hypothetical protein
MLIDNPHWPDLARPDIIVPAIATAIIATETAPLRGLPDPC